MKNAHRNNNSNNNNRMKATKEEKRLEKRDLDDNDSTEKVTPLAHWHWRATIRDDDIFNFQYFSFVSTIVTMEISLNNTVK